MINVTFESPRYNVTEGNPVEVCVRTTDSRIKSQQQVNVMVIITPVISGMSLLHRNSPNTIIIYYRLLMLSEY